MLIDQWLGHLLLRHWSIFKCHLMHGKRLDAGRYLSSSRSARVRVEGNCNERGGREQYNLALGQKRAEVVHRWLVPTGAYGSALETVS